jgi:hypothetical protein
MPLVTGVAAAWLSACASFGADVQAPAGAAASGPHTLSALTAEGRLVRFSAAQPASLITAQWLDGFPDGALGAAQRGSGWLFVQRDGRLVPHRSGDGGDAAASTAAPAQAIAASFTAAPSATPPAAAPWPLPTPVPAPDAAARCPLDLARHPLQPHWRLLAAGAHGRLDRDRLQLVDGDAALPGVQGDAPLRYAPGDVHYGRTPKLAALAHALGPADADTGRREVTTYAIDAATGSLLSLGRVAGDAPREAPQGGRLHTRGPLGTGGWHCARLAIAPGLDGQPVGYLALGVARADAYRTDLYRIDLAHGATQWLGTVPVEAALLGLWVEDDRPPPAGLLTRR